MQNQRTQSNSEYRNLAIELLEESPSNPRRRFNPESLKELAESFKSQGILQPLVVRAITKEGNNDENKYEVIAGARRLRAAQLAELKTVPVRVVDLSDSDAVLAQVTENLQREDIHPLEEAFGFQSLLNLNDLNDTMASLAAKAGKSEAYVLGRIKLTELIPAIADAFLADRITIGHALLIAKLPAAQQQEAFNACFRQMWTSEGNTQVLVLVRELAAWIESNILLDLTKAPFSKSDETLLPEAGSCANCPKRTGFNKTTLLNTLANFISEDDRILVIEDTAEIQINSPNLVRFEARREQEELPAVSIRDLLKASLRHRPDRILLGEIRGAEAFDLLQLLNTGHSGTISTVHANSALQALSRFTSCVLQSDVELPYRAIKSNIADSVNLLVHVERRPGRRFVSEVLRIEAYDPERDRYSFDRMYSTEQQV